MVDITHKSTTLRTAIAEATVKVSKTETIDAIKNKTVPKGDVFSMSKAAGFLAVKKTSDLLPDCHPMPIEYTSIDYEIRGLDIVVTITVKTIYKTGVEVEAMHGASVVALNMYDMLKPIDKGIEIQNIRLVSKTGGKSSFTTLDSNDIVASVLVCSDAISSGEKSDEVGQIITSKLNENNITISDYKILAQEDHLIEANLTTAVKNNIPILIITGGTSVSRGAKTAQVIEPLLETRVLGIEETMRSYGQDRTPYAMLSQSLAGTIGNTLVIVIPGSTAGARQSMDALFPGILHLFRNA